jgi:molecular chaperone HtpG
LLDYADFDLGIEWNEWFINEYPKVEYFVDEEKLESTFVVSRNGFNKFSTHEFKLIEWRYSDSEDDEFRNCMVACNGILITKDLEYHKEDFVHHDFEPEIYNDIEQNKREPFVISKRPTFFFEDPDGLFPLKLDRNDIDCHELPFEKILIEEVSKDFIAQILCLNILHSKYGINKNEVKYHKAPILYTKNGYSFGFDYFIRKLKENKTLTKIITTGNVIYNRFLEYQDVIILPVFEEKIGLSDQEYKVAPNCNGARVLLREQKYTRLFKEKKRVSVWAKKNHSVTYNDGNYVLYDIEEFQAVSSILSDIEKLKYDLTHEIESIQELNFNYFKLMGGKILNSLLEKYIGGRVIIPYSIKDRKNRYELAFKELNEFMLKYLQ